MNDALQVTFLTTAGAGVGLGHLKRCAALAGALANLRVKAHFIVAADAEPLMAEELEPHSMTVLQWTNVPELALEALARRPADALVVDCYAVGSEFLRALRSVGRYVVAIDDMADRPLPVDLVVNGAYHAERLSYRSLPSTAFLLGSRYALLDPAFSKLPRRPTRREPSRVLLTLGGQAGGQVVEEIAASVSRAAPAAAVDVVVGPFAAAPAKDRDRMRIHCGLPSLRQLLWDADLAVTGAGMTVYECLAAGTPAVAMCLADNQQANLEELGRAGLIIPSESRLEWAIERLVADAGLREALSVRGREVVDGKGAGRVAGQIGRAVGAVHPEAE